MSEHQEKQAVRVANVPAADFEAAVTRLAAVEGEVRSLRLDVARLRESRSPAERDADNARFLHVVASAVKGTVFSSSALLAHTRHDADLRAALDGYTPQRLGNRLRDLAGHAVGPFRVGRVKREWFVHVSTDVQHDAGVDTDAGV